MSFTSASYHWLARRGFLTYRGRRNRLSTVCAWLFLNILAILIPFCLGVLLGLSKYIFSPDLQYVFGEIIGGLYAATLCAAMVMTIFLWIQRLHDLGKTGWFLLLFLIPGINILFLLYLLFAPSKDGSNEYGPNPLTTPYVADTVFSWNQTNPYREA